MAGLVVNETTLPGSLAEETNVEELRRRIEVPLLAVFPFQGEAAQADLSALAMVDWWQLCHARTGCRSH